MGQIQKLLFILENGLGAYDELTEENEVYDDYRIDYLKKHIEQMSEAIEDGEDVDKDVEY